MSTEDDSRDVAALETVKATYGERGVQAVALFMQAMGSDAGLTWDSDLATVWTPCDMVMQLAWSMAPPDHG